MFKLIVVKKAFAGFDDLNKTGVIAHEGLLYLVDNFFRCVILKIGCFIVFKAVAVCFFVV